MSLRYRVTVGRGSLVKLSEHQYLVSAMQAAAAAFTRGDEDVRVTDSETGIVWTAGRTGRRESTAAAKKAR